MSAQDICRNAGSVFQAGLIDEPHAPEGRSLESVVDVSELLSFRSISLFVIVCNIVVFDMANIWRRRVKSRTYCTVMTATQEAQLEGDVLFTTETSIEKSSVSPHFVLSLCTGPIHTHIAMWDM